MDIVVVLVISLMFHCVNANAETPPLISEKCVGCHDNATAEGGLNITTLKFDLTDRALRDRWVRIHDRIEQGEMPPNANDLPKEQRAALVKSLRKVLHDADLADVVKSGRGPMRRLNRDEYAQNLRDILELPDLDVRDMLPEDRVSRHFNKTAEVLDISKVQLAAYLDAAEAALLHATASGVEPPSKSTFRAFGRNLFAEHSTFGEREAMFFARDGKALAAREVDENPEDPAIELALFRSAHWPYYGYPRGFVAKQAGAYRLRFSARAVLQESGFTLKPGTKTMPMTFRARKPSGPDVSGDVRATGGLIDIQPAIATFETVIHLRERETFEYSLLGLPVPLARNVNGGPPTYRYPPFPEGGQPGVAFQWLEVEGPLSPATWPPPSHRVLFDDLPIRGRRTGDSLPVEVVSEEPEHDAKRLLRRFIARASRQPLSEDDVRPFEQLVLARLKQGVAFGEALLSGYQAFLASGHFLFLPEPRDNDQFAIASRLSYFLSNTRPDNRLLNFAREGRLLTPKMLEDETQRLIADDAGFARFVRNFTDYWLNLRYIHRDEPDPRLFPEYRFDAYLVESMERETRTFVAAMIRENLPARSLVQSDFVFVNDRLATHYQLPAVSGSNMRQVRLPPESAYGGLLTQAAILKVTANGTTTSPVVRGAWIMDRLVGQPPPAPPASVPAVEPDIRGAKTIRDLLALHTKSTECAACHARFDPVGLALENFDILGAWRTRYRGLETGVRVTGIDRAGHDFIYTHSGPVDASGKLRDGREFANIHDLKKLLAQDDRQLARNLLHQFAVYATGTPIRFADRTEIERILDLCAADRYRVGNLLRGLITSSIFTGAN